jgi:hypothetical protein
MKIYVAASHKGGRSVVQHLRDKGYDVVSTWDIDDVGYCPDSHFRAARDVAQIREADLVVVCCGDRLSGGGRHTELGLAMGLGKVIICVGDYDDNVFERLCPLVTVQHFCETFK